MITLKIEETGGDRVEELVKDVCHTHPEWVHSQLGTESESELQTFLDGVSAVDYLEASAKLKRWEDSSNAADECGIYYDGPLYRVRSSFIDHNGVNCWNDTAEALGDYAFKYFTDEDKAQDAADDLADDLDDDSTVSYSVEQVR